MTLRPTQGSADRRERRRICQACAHRVLDLAEARRRGTPFAELCGKRPELPTLDGPFLAGGACPIGTWDGKTGRRSTFNVQRSTLKARRRQHPLRLLP